MYFKLPFTSSNKADKSKATSTEARKGLIKARSSTLVAVNSPYEFPLTTRFLGTIVNYQNIDNTRSASK